MYRKKDLENIERVTGLTRKQVESALTELKTFGWIDVDTSGQITTKVPAVIRPTKIEADAYREMKL